MNRNEDPAGTRSTAAFVLSLLAGSLMLLSHCMMVLTHHMGERHAEGTMP